MEYNGYTIVNDDVYPTLKRIEIIGRGSVHLNLRGYYSNTSYAKSAIDKQLKKKGRGNGETNNSD